MHFPLYANRDWRFYVPGLIKTCNMLKLIVYSCFGKSKLREPDCIEIHIDNGTNGRLIGDITLELEFFLQLPYHRWIWNVADIKQLMQFTGGGRGGICRDLHGTITGVGYNLRWRRTWWRIRGVKGDLSASSGSGDLSARDVTNCALAYIAFDGLGRPRLRNESIRYETKERIVSGSSYGAA